MIDSVERLAKMAPFEAAEDEKTPLLLEAMNALTKHHALKSPFYRKILEAHGTVPGSADSLEALFCLPVPLFKRFDLRSSDEIVRTLVSSGTTGQKPSRIFLDRETAILQSRLLTRIVQSFIGRKRLPMMIVDTPSVVGRQGTHSARAAGILGFSNFGRDHTYLLDDAMRLDAAGLRRFLERHDDGPLLMFGFTYMVWKYLYEPLQKSGIDLSRVILIHGGGWKKLVSEKVDDAVFRRELERTTGMRRIHNYYGMVEQVGSIFMACEAGHLHAPVYADIIVRDPVTLAPLPAGRRGLIELLSIVPGSYPGHVILSEDEGAWLGVDDCPCGRKGRYFKVLGRTVRAEPRGCSDTFAAKEPE